MVTTQKDLGQTAPESRKSSVDIFMELKSDIRLTMDLVWGRLMNLAGPNERKNMEISIPLKDTYDYEPEHGKQTRLQTDHQVTTEIKDHIKTYLQEIRSTSDNIEQSAKSQGWSTEKQEAVMQAVNDDAHTHTQELRSLNVSYFNKIQEATTYSDVIALAAMFKGDVIAITKDISPHLLTVAKKASFKGVIRTGQ